MSTVLEGAGVAWDAPTFDAAVATCVHTLRERGTRVLATRMDNGPAWVVADAAAQEAGVVHVPLPVFFTPQQVAHALQAAGVDTLLADAATATALGGTDTTPVRCGTPGTALVLAKLRAHAVPLPPGTSKITFTSGTTGTPKGVCLRADAMQRAAAALVQALEPLDIRRHLCVLPLPVLLENLAGVLAPLARGATVVVPPLADVGLAGSSGFTPAVFHAAVERHAPHSMILLPQMLRAWTGWLQNSGRRAPASLRMVAVGGAAVGAALLQAARACGIPAYEGYGLSEGGSVQTLNLPGADLPGAAGRPLPHARLRIAADGEIEIAGTLMAGYLGNPRPVPPWWPTGDLGRIDAQGFLHVAGRKKDVLVTGFGRNVSPEWVETALRADPLVAQAVVLGDGQPALSAVLWPLTPEISDSALDHAVAAANTTLPDYARVQRWVRAQAAFSPATGLATPNGRPRRAEILALHAPLLGLAPNPNEQGHHALLR